MLQSSSAEKETKAESSLGVGGTGQVAGSSSSSQQEPVLPGASIDKKFKPDQIDSALHGSTAEKETEGGAYSSGVQGAGQVVGSSTASPQELFDK